MAHHVSERKRVREVRKYYNRSPDDVPIAGLPLPPGQDGLESTKGMATTAVASPNKTLTALMQLIAVRLGMQRAMVSVVDENAQYFLAESTKTLDLVDPLQHDDGDELWMGCGGTVRSEALCANTIKLPYQKENYACFSVSDLPSDPRFRKLPYVAGPPFFRFYAGTPLLTRDGVPIGSVFVIDTRPRGPPTKFEINILGVMAKNVMEYLEMRRESEMRIRNEIMSQGLAALVDGKPSIRPRLEKSKNYCTSKELITVNEDKPTILNTDEYKIDALNFIPVAASQREEELSSKFVELDELKGTKGASYMQTKLEQKPPEEILTDEKIMGRAANILRESLGVDYSVFLDVLDESTASSPTESPNPSRDSNPNGHEAASTQQEPSFFLVNGAITPPEERKDITFEIRDHRPPNQRDNSNDSQCKGPLAKVISFASETGSSISGEAIDQDFDFHPPNCKQLRKLLTRYPEGKLWTLNDDGAELSDDEDEDNNLHGPSKAARRRETQFLAQWFPGARQIVYAPLFHVEKAIHVAACFCVLFTPTPIFTVELEVAFIRSFMNNVSVACNRASMAAQNRLKGDFISSISHELRSPLHGILASVELLSSSALDKRQKEYCTTISTCGQALLETITGILEYTKINTLKKDAQGTGKPKDNRPLLLRNESSQENLLKRPVSDLLASSNMDLGKVCEDSCLLVAAAYMHHTASPDQPLYRVFVPPEAAQQLNGECILSPAAVVVILDIAPGDWKLVALPGALQRIVMNLVGNSLKYTASGFIRVKLAMESVVTNTDDKTSAVVELHVIDSGRGISNEFLKTKLFSPFSQETILAPGTGLGLHLVKNLVQMHEGSIDIQSEVGKGTHVTVKMRLNQAPKGCDVSESGLGLAQDILDNSIADVTRHHKDKSFLLYGFNGTTSTFIKDSLQLYLNEWFNMLPASEGTEAHVIITTEAQLADCVKLSINYRQRPRVIVICDPIREKFLTENNKVPNSVELLTIPFGPHKLSKSILACFEQEEPKQSPKTVNGFHIHNPDAAAFANGGMFSPPALFESPCSSTGTNPSDSFPWNAPATQNPVSMHNVRVLPAPANDATLPIRMVQAPPPPQLLICPNTIAPKPVDTVTELAVKDETQPRILCVDDNSINLRLLKTFMEKLKFKNITCAENGSLAFEAVRCQKESFDLIFMDLSMPVCDGFQAISLIRTLEKINLEISSPNLPPPKRALIVALTGLASQRDQDTARNAGADHYITKPMKLSKLKELLAEWKISPEGVA